MSTSIGPRPSSRRAPAVVVAVAVLAGLVLAFAPPPVAQAATGPVVSIGSASIVETTSPVVAGPVKVPITLSQAQATDVVVTWVVSGGSATGGADYKAITKPKTTKIGAGKVRGFATVQVYGDTVVEGDETIVLTLTGVSGGSGITLGPPNGGITIVEEPQGGPAVSMGDTTAVEGDTPLVPAAARLPITLSEPVGVDVVVTWSVSGGTATAGTDFKAITKPKTTKIRAGKTTAAAAITLYGDTAAEPDESVEVTISGVVGATLSGSTTGTVSIVDDDDAAPPPVQETNLWTWGRNDVGQLGNGGLGDDAVPAWVVMGAPATFTDVTAGDFHSCGITEDDRAWCWGDNYWGQLGDGTTTRRSVPTMLENGIGNPVPWATISGGSGHTCATKGDGTLWCWGRNDEGQLGDGTTDEAHDVQTVGADTDWTTVSAGGLHTCAIKINGTLWCWGDNSQGQLGDGSTTDSSEPVQVGNQGGWVGVTTGTYHTCGLREDLSTALLTLWCWGWNGFGQLGDGTNSNRNDPTQVGTDSWSFLISAGHAHTCGVEQDGTLWCWGWNASGQLGDGTTDDRWVPTQVGTESGWADVAAGNAHSCGVRYDGPVFCWGWNFYGQLGDGTFDDSLEPVQATAINNVLGVSAGFHTVARQVAPLGP